ncbi:MAG: D-aminoacyl-tRNA deacylase [Thermoplasmata archaeon]
MPYLLVVSEVDPVASRVVEHWGTPESTGEFVDGAPIRRLSSAALLLRRSSLHIRDERLDLRLPTALREAGTTLVFPSIHRSERGIESLTVHPLGNPGPSHEVGGRPRTLNPTDPQRMTDALRRLIEGSSAVGLPATFEATHHGPELGLPSFFVEIGYGDRDEPPIAAVRLLAEILPELGQDLRDRTAVGAGGGHYAPHFTELARRRRWSFGHLLSRHALEEIDAATADASVRLTPGAEGIVFARAEDRSRPQWANAGPRLKDQLAPSRSEAQPSS